MIKLRVGSHPLYANKKALAGNKSGELAELLFAYLAPSPSRFAPSV